MDGRKAVLSRRKLFEVQDKEILPKTEDQAINDASQRTRVTGFRINSRWPESAKVLQKNICQKMHEIVWNLK